MEAQFGGAPPLPAADPACIGLTRAVEREPGQEEAPTLLSRARERVQQLEARAQAERYRHGSVDAVFDMVERDAEVAGGIIAGSLAYRLFIWVLPLALVAVAGLGIAADASSGSPEEAAEQLGVEGLVSNSIANAANSSNRWYALAIGVPVLLWATRSVLRVLIGAHRLVWREGRAAAPKPSLVATVRLLVLLLSFAAVSGAANVVRAWSPGPGLLATLATFGGYAGLWLLVSLHLPRRGDWRALVPGALLFGIGLEILNLVVAYVITPWALARQGTYGALGIAAALLLGLFLVSRLAVAAAVMNATLWERRGARA
jgi:membrane protein